MGRYSPAELRHAISLGLLAFPVTHATADFEFDEAGYREHVAHLAGFSPAGIFAAGGMGEFFSLTPEEVSKVTRATRAELESTAPVLSAAGYGTSLAVRMAQQAEADGADGILLLPPYLTGVSQRGLFDHVSRVCDSVSIGVIVYHRANARYQVDTIEQLAAKHENFIGFKDGLGEIELLTELRAVLGERLVKIGGLPTAEISARAFREVGVDTYSSAIFNFAPRWALDFYQAVTVRDDDVLDRMTRSFLLPYVAIRTREPGYAVAIVKSGLKVVGRPAGPVRPPLSDLTPTDFEELAHLIRAGSLS